MPARIAVDAEFAGVRSEVLWVAIRGAKPQRDDLPAADVPPVQLQVLDCDAGGELDGALEARQPGASVTIRCAGRANASCATSISADAWGCAARQS